MARKNWNDDYIPNAADIAAKQDKMKEWQKNHSIPDSYQSGLPAFD